MKKLLTLAFALIGMLSATKSSAVIYPTSHTACVGAATTLFDSSGPGPSAGTWSSSNLAVATIGSSTGILTGLTPGTTVITFTGSTTSTAVFTINPAPAAITGAGSSFCVGSSITLASATSGGTWYSGSSYVATVGAATGVCTGAHAGTTTIYYTLATGCSASVVVTVTGTIPDSISGPSTVCVGGTITLSSTTSGTWTSAIPSVATVSSAGVVTGVATGVALISHTVSGPCGPYTTTRSITVTSGGSAGTISGTTSVAVGFTTSLYSTVSGGTWSSGSTGIATVSTSGVVTGVATGTAVITYTVAGCVGPVYATTTVTVTTADCISGDVLFTGTPLYGPVKVWLIKYNPTTHMLTACDSTYVYASGASAHYSFCGMGTDSFRVKAADDSMVAGTGYIPTYHNASAYWGTATVIYHVAGTHDINKNITMGYGTTTSGPGFIAGDVTTGANKGTADIPAVGLLIYCVNNSTGAILQRTITDASGHYSFSNLPTGTPIKIYPELINYATTPYPAITLTSSAASMTAASFIQHTLSLIITPVTSAVGTVNTNNADISVYPNPAENVLNVKWNNIATGTASVVITDITGRRVISRSVDMVQTNGTATIDATNLNCGTYIVSISGNGINYNTILEKK